MDKKPIDDILKKRQDSIGSQHTSKWPEPTARSTASTEGDLPLQHQSNRNNRYLYILLALFFVIGFSLTAYVLFAQNTINNSTSQQPSPANFAPIQQKTPAEKLIDAVKESLNATPVVTQLTEELNGRAVDGAAVVYSVPTFQLREYSFINSPQIGYGTAVTSAASDKSVTDGEYEKVVAVLIGNGLELVKGTVLSSVSQKSALYADDKIVCATTTLYNIRGSDFSGVGCGDISSYEEAARLIKPLHESFLSAANVETKAKLEQKPPVYRPPKIEEGNDGFSRAILRMNNSTTEVFYREGTEPWKYFKGFDSIALCAEFNTPELKKAFDGYSCKDDGGMSTAL